MTNCHTTDIEKVSKRLMNIFIHRHFQNFVYDITRSYSVTLLFRIVTPLTLDVPISLVKCFILRIGTTLNFVLHTTNLGTLLSE